MKNKVHSYSKSDKWLDDLFIKSILRRILRKNVDHFILLMLSDKVILQI